MMDQKYRLLAAKYIRRQTKQLAGQLDGVCVSEDIEYVHRARVATRRLRAALKMFSDCFDPKQVKQWQKEIRRTTNSLSNARDRDVQIDFLYEVLASVDSKQCVPGIAALLARWERDRGRLQPEIVKAIDRLQAKGILGEMRREARKILRQSETLVQSSHSPNEAKNQSGRHILRRIEALLKLQDCLENQYDRERHHAMRIALKRLRYTLEISQPLYDGQIDETIKAVKRVQTFLGDMHDCDVWLDDLDGFLVVERKRIKSKYGCVRGFQRLRPGIEYLQEDRRSKRRLAFSELVGFWKELNDRRFWEQLKSIVIDRQSAATDLDLP